MEWSIQKVRNPVQIPGGGQNRGRVRKLTARFSVLEYWVPSSGTSVLAQTQRGIRRGRRLKKGRLSWKEAEWETGQQELQGDRTS